MINLRYIFLLPVFSTLVFVSPAHAFKLTFVPTGDIVKNPGDKVTFFLSMSDFNGKTLSQLTFDFGFDASEIVEPNVQAAPNSGGNVIKNGGNLYTITNLNEKTQTSVGVGSVTFDVIAAIQDHAPDFWLKQGAKANGNTEVEIFLLKASNTENTSSVFLPLPEETVDISPEFANIIPVPEPSSIIGFAAGIGILLNERKKRLFRSRNEN
ncbi:PEP-CTERM sorting domain-containing protein [Microcoleus sp. D2B6]|uniref:PEP-CTERM sorting domain-containing protein n=1 Tax=unclassified Microcoleus TaxID=2642155 RepID=UPI002FD1437C